MLETALPAKFNETIREALQCAPVRPADLAGIEALPQRVDGMAPDVAAMVLFLASDDAQMCTAQEFLVDAGWV